MLRIGLIADTHELEEPISLIRQLGKLGCDYNIHLGDIGASPTGMKMVRIFKERKDSMMLLTEEQRREFHELVRNGVTPVGAWVEITVGNTEEARLLRRTETEKFYHDVVTTMETLHRPIILGGNVDKVHQRLELVGRLFRDRQMPFINEPAILHVEDNAIVLWPSMSPMMEGHRLERIACDFAEQLRGKRRVAVLAHEQLFRGPVPSVYRENVERAGFKATTIPHYEPSSTRKYVLGMLRALQHAQVCFVHGHVHDPQEVLAAGAPHLRSRNGNGLEYRLYGLGNGSPRPSDNTSSRRTFPTYCVGARQVAVLTSSSEGFRFETFGADDQWLK